jgi:hypothetical protein
MKIEELLDLETTNIVAEKKQSGSRKKDDTWLLRLCKSSKSNKELGASNLSSCKSRGLRSREGQMTHKIGGQRQKVAGRKIRGKKYGGPLPDWSK